LANTLSEDSSSGGLEQEFQNPPKAAHPWVYWMWLNGNISREGITADLEAMRRVGIGGALIMELGAGSPGPVHFMSPEYRAMIQHAISEAARLGLQIDLNNDDGWNNGGPWITPDLAMQRMTWTETNVRGPASFHAPLEKPQTKLDFYRDVAAIAYRTPPEDSPSARIPDSQVVKLPGPPAGIELNFPRPVAVQSLVLTTAITVQGKPASAALQASQNGSDFQTVCEFETGWRHGASRYPSITASFPKAEGRVFRLVFPEGIGAATPLEVRLSPAPRLSAWELKGGHANIGEHASGAEVFTLGREPKPAIMPNQAIARDGVVDLTSRMGADGSLTWDVPPGEWTILRIGYTPTGATNGASTVEGLGLDCDKLRREGAEAVFAGMLDKLLAENQAYRGKSLTWFHSDSWESGPQNWTEGLQNQFRNRCGYDLLPFFPVLAGGHVVDSVAVSDRFLWDFRRLLADLILTEFVKPMREMCHARGVGFTCEATGRQQFLNDPIAYQSETDLPMGEFWVGEMYPRPDCKASASTGHTYGKEVIGAESYTSTGGTHGWWLDHPYSLKAEGDEAFCTGINHIVFHRYVHQPWLDRKPGMAWAGMGGSVMTGPHSGIGINFERTQTWWEQGAAWLQYIARCAYLLRKGSFVADICYSTGEGVPNAIIRWNRHLDALPEGRDPSTVTQRGLARCGALPPEPPLGYDYDGCDQKMLMQMSVRDGRVTLPNGMSYAVLVLPPQPAMTPQLAGKIKDLLQAGATVVARKPYSSPSLRAYPECDREVHRLADELWGEADNSATVNRSIGRGKLLWGTPLDEVLQAAGVPQDFHYTSAQPQADVHYIHRQWGDAEVYFVSNQLYRDEVLSCTFRVGGKTPELWQPETGEIRKVAFYSQKGGSTTLPLRLGPAESVFVVFREAASTRSVVSAAPLGMAVGSEFELSLGTSGSIEGTAWDSGRYTIRDSRGEERKIEPKVPAPLAVGGPWILRFPPGLGAPAEIQLSKLISWTDHPDDGVRYFSGTAEYTAQIDIPGALVGDDYRAVLDLGEVKEIAEVAVNGRTVRTLWKPPFRAEVTKLLKPGTNRLTIHVTNLWANRLVGDSKLPTDQRVSWSTWNPYTSDFKLLPSGLLGPVTLRIGRRFTL